MHALKKCRKFYAGFFLFTSCRDPYIILYRIPVPDYLLLTGLALKILPLSDKSPLGFSPLPAHHSMSDG